MPTTTHEPSGLIAIRALVDMERERQDHERAAAAAREAAATEARLAAEAAARAEAEAHARAAAEAAERARQAEALRRHDERLRAAEIEGRLRATQAAHLAQVQAELDARVEVRRGGRLGLWTAATLGVLGLGLAFLLKGPAAIAPAPVLAPAESDPEIADARAQIEQMRRELARLDGDNAANREALIQAIADKENAVAAAKPEPAPVVRPRPAARPKPAEKPPGTKPGGIKICDTNDPLAEDC